MPIMLIDPRRGGFGGEGGGGGGGLFDNDFGMPSHRVSLPGDAGLRPMDETVVRPGAIVNAWIAGEITFEELQEALPNEEFRNNLLSTFGYDPEGNLIDIVGEPIFEGEKIVYEPPPVEEENNNNGGESAPEPEPEPEEIDTDGDGIPDIDDAFPEDPTRWEEEEPVIIERGWEYIGNGRFRDVLTGEIILDPTYNAADDPYIVGDVYSRGPEETGEEPTKKAPDLTFGGLPDIFKDTTDDDGIVDEGSGNGGDGSVDEGNGDEGNGDEGNGDEGNGDEGNGDEGNGDGELKDLSLGSGMMASTPSFDPFMAGISYTAPQIQSIIQNPQTNYIAALNNIINKGMLV